MLPLNLAAPGNDSFESTLDSLRAALFSSGGYAYVIVDPILGEPWERPWRDPATSGRKSKEYVMSLEKFGVEKASSPFLVQLDDSRSFLLDESLDLAMADNDKLVGAQRVCGWFSSPLPPSAICRLLQRQMTRPSAKGPWLFRFHDPRTLRHLPWILGASFKLPAVHTWFCLDNQSRLRKINGHPHEHDPVEIAEDAWPMLDVIAVVNAAYAQWLTLADSIPEDAVSRLFEAARLGVQLGLDLDQQADCISFTLHRCLVHPTIERHPAVAHWIEEARLKHATYVDAAAVGSAQLWKEIESGTWTIQHGACIWLMEHG